MILTLAIMGLIVAIIVLSIRYFMIYARLRSHTSMDTEAKRRAQVLRFEDPVITCDYCGATIDTSRDKVCPQCGASYSHDKEWTSKFEVDPEWVEANAEDMYNAELNSTRAQAARTAKLLKKLILILVGIVAVLIAIGIAVTVLDIGVQYAEDEELNVYSDDAYEPVSYDFAGDEVLIDTEYARVTLEGIYKDEASGRYKLGYRLENLTDEPVRIRFERLAVNGLSNESETGFMYERLKKNSAVTVYDSIRTSAEELGDIGELVFGNRQVTVNDDYDDVWTSDEYAYVTTSASNVLRGTLPSDADKELLTSKNGVSIYSVILPATEYEEAKRGIAIVNETDDDFIISGTGCRINGSEGDLHSIYKDILLHSCTYYLPEISAYDADSNKAEHKDRIELTISFSCSKDPAKDFSSGYLEMKSINK